MRTPDASNGGADHHQGGHAGPEAETPDQAARHLTADQRIFQKMVELDFDADGPVGELLVQRLRREGTGTLVGLHIAGELFVRAHRIGVHLPSPPLSWSDDARSVISEAGTIAAPRFVSRRLRKWSPTPRAGRAPASILTYFTNSTIMYELKTMYTKYCRDRRIISAGELLHDPATLPSGPSYSEDWTDHVANRVDVDALLRGASPRAAQIARQVADGVPHAEIARALNIDVRTIRSHLNKLARQQPTLHGRTGEE